MGRAYTMMKLGYWLRDSDSDALIPFETYGDVYSGTESPKAMVSWASPFKAQHLPRPAIPTRCGLYLACVPNENSCECISILMKWTNTKPTNRTRTTTTFIYVYYSV